MALYGFACTECEKTMDVKIPMADYDKEKDNVMCPDCGSKMERTIGRSVFQMRGVGWFAGEGTGYGITEMETRKNLDEEKRLEDTARSQIAKDRGWNQ